TSAVRCYSRGLARSLIGSSLRTQGPITPGLKSEERPRPQCRNESPRRKGPCVRRDDSLIRHAYDQPQPCIDTAVASHDLPAGRPCERRDPSPLASKVRKGLCSNAETRVRGAAMSAIALTLGSLRSQGRLVDTSRI